MGRRTGDVPRFDRVLVEGPASSWRSDSSIGRRPKADGNRRRRKWIDGPFRAPPGVSMLTRLPRASDVDDTSCLPLISLEIPAMAYHRVPSGEVHEFPNPRGPPTP